MYLFQAISSGEFALKEKPKYINKIVAPTLEPIRSISGFRTLPDYSFETMPDDYFAIVLIGGFGWETPIADQVVPIVRQAIEKRKDCRCDMQRGFLHGKTRIPQYRKTYGQRPEQLKVWGGDNYTNYDGYVHSQAVCDNNIVTANGSAALEFAKEMLLLIENDTPERIEMYYQFNRQGFCSLFGNQQMTE